MSYVGSAAAAQDGQVWQPGQAARDDAAFNELIARLDEEDDDSDG
jgi:hypothetical protein